MSKGEQITCFGVAQRPQRAKVNKNYHTMCGMVGAANVAQEERSENDFYATDPIAAEWLMQLEDLDHNIWECACGQGNLSKVFERGGTT